MDNDELRKLADSTLVERVANDIVGDVCDLPGDDDIEADDTLIVSVGVLHLIVTRNIAALRQPAPRADDALREAFAVADAAPELCPSNYDNDQVCELNAAMIELHSTLRAALVAREEPQG